MLFLLICINTTWVFDFFHACCFIITLSSSQLFYWCVQRAGKWYWSIDAVLGSSVSTKCQHISVPS